MRIEVDFHPQGDELRLAIEEQNCPLTLLAVVRQATMKVSLSDLERIRELIGANGYNATFVDAFEKFRVAVEIFENTPLGVGLCVRT